MFVTGYGKLHSLAASKVYEVIVVAVTIDPLIPQSLSRFHLQLPWAGNLSKLVEGYCPDDGVEGLEERLERYYHGSARLGFGYCLYNIYNRYEAFQKRASIEDLD